MIVFATEYKQAFYDKENILDPLKNVSYKLMYSQIFFYTFKNKGFILGIFCNPTT